MPLNRSKTPKIYPILNLELPEPDLYYLDNGIPVYQVDLGTQEVCKIELVFPAGRAFESKRLAGRATTSLLKEGTRSFSAADLAETLDFYGATLQTPSNLDTSSIVLYTLNRCLEDVLPLLRSIIAEPVFSEQELQSFVKRNQQRLLVDLTKVDMMSFRQITESMFGPDHAYGFNSTLEMYADLTRADLLEHYQRLFTADNCRIFVSGKVPGNMKNLLNHYLGSGLHRGTVKPDLGLLRSETPGKVHVKMPDTVQSSVRIGCRLFNRQHADYTAMYVLNTVLGGYFGSRLMANIREEKGYTYNISSSIDTLLFDGYFCVGTEVGNEFVTPAIQEIYREMAILQEELIDDDELEMVRNYLLGNILTSLDGPFNVAEVIKSQIVDELSIAQFAESVEIIREIDATTLRNLARQYFNRESMWEIVAGV